MSAGHERVTAIFEDRDVDSITKNKLDLSQFSEEGTLLDLLREVLFEHREIFKGVVFITGYKHNIRLSPET